MEYGKDKRQMSQTVEPKHIKTKQVTKEQFEDRFWRRSEFWRSRTKAECSTRGSTANVFYYLTDSNIAGEAYRIACIFRRREAQATIHVPYGSFQEAISSAVNKFARKIHLDDQNKEKEYDIIQPSC